MKPYKSYKQMLREEKDHLPLAKRARFSAARQYYLNPKSETYLNGKASFVKAGYAESTASTYAANLFKEGYRIPEFRIDPEDRQGVLDNLNSWLSLMDKWRDELSEKDPLDIPTKTYSVISAHIERLARIFGFIKEFVVNNRNETNIVQINNMAVPEQYDKLKIMVNLLVSKIKEIEEKISVPVENRFHF